MSAVSSQFSFRPSPPWKIGARLLNIMDSIYAIAFGLGLRTLVDAVSQNFKLTGSLIGLWEGVIMLHFLKKMPKSSDPYIAYGVRLFVDFLVTESVGRLVLVLIWTAFGMVLADVTPAIWDEVGLKRVWRHFRRDLYTIYDRIPTVAFFPPPRTVRFLPSQEPSIISPSIATSHDTPITVIPPSSTVPSEPLKRRVPGHYPGDYSDTDTDRGSIIRHRPSPRTEVDIALVSDLDEDRQSSGVSSSDSTEMGDHPSFTQEDIPDMEEEQALVDIEEAIPDPTTPKQKPKYMMPPTPSDSAAPRDLYRNIVEDVIHGKPRPEMLPDIPDSMEDGTTSDGWVKVQREGSGEDRPPTPPAKDKPVGGLNVSIPMIPSHILPVPPLATRMNMNMGSTSTNPFGIDYSALETFSSRQVLSTTTEQRRESGPPPYDDYDDIYYNSPPSHDNEPATADNDANINEYIENNNNDANDDNNNFANMASQQDGEFNPGANSTILPTSFDAEQDQADAMKEEGVKQVEEEVRLEGEEAENVQEDAEEEGGQKEAERVWKEEGVQKEAEKTRKEAEEKKKAEERAERKKKEDDDDALRKQRQAEEKRRKDDEAEKKRKDDEAEKKRKDDEAEKKRKDDEAEKKRKDDEAEEKRKDEVEKKRKDEAEKKRKDEAEKKRKDEAEKKRKDDEAEKKRKDEAEKTRKDDEAEKKKRKDEEEEKKRNDDEAEKKRKDEEEQVNRKAEEQAKQKEKEVQEARDNTEKQRQEDATKQKEKEREEADRIKAETQEKLESGAKEGDVITPETEAQQAELDEQKRGEIRDPPLTITAPNTTTEPPRNSIEEESAPSEATDQPQEAKERLERMMTLRAQMVELEKFLDQRKAGGSNEQSPEVKSMERTLKKFRRQAERRHAAGIQLAQHLCHPQDKDDDIYLEGLTPDMVGEKLEEKLEELLAPTSSSICFSLTFPKKDAGKQRPVVVRFLDTYNLTDYTMQIPRNRKALIEVPQETFAEWLIGYRTLAAKREMEDDGNIYGGMLNR